MKLGAHAHNNMGIRTSSMGELYPYIIVAKGNPHAGGIRWHIQHAGSSKLSSASFERCRDAEALARRWLELDRLEARDGSHVV